MPATQAKVPVIIHVIKTTFSGLIPDNKANSLLSEQALIDFPVFVLFKNQKSKTTKIMLKTIVIPCVVFNANPSLNPV